MRKIFHVVGINMCRNSVKLNRIAMVPYCHRRASREVANNGIAMVPRSPMSFVDFNGISTLTPGYQQVSKSTNLSKKTLRKKRKR
jgi:hypothetical protein